MPEPTLTSIELPGLKQRQLDVYDFARAGDEIPLHDHGAEDVHTTTVNKGRIRAYGPGWERILEPGAIVVWVVGQAHALQALEPGSRLTNERY